MRVYDADGEERTFEWALDKYNPVLIPCSAGVDHWELVELREVVGPSSMTVRLVGDARDVGGIPVAFYWPDAPFESLPMEPKPRHVAQLTDKNGRVGFGMGSGAWYRPHKGEHGPHAVWVAEYPDFPSDCVDGLGMLVEETGATVRAHLEPTFRFVRGQEGLVGPVEEALEAYLEGVRGAADRALDILEGGLRVVP